MDKNALLNSIDTLCNTVAIHLRDPIPAYRRVSMQEDANAEVLREMFKTSQELLEAVPEGVTVPLPLIQPLFDGAHARIPYMAENEGDSQWLTEHVVQWEQSVRAQYGE